MVWRLQIRNKASLTHDLQCVQGKEYVFIANSDNLGAIVDLSIHTFNFLDFISML